MKEITIKELNLTKSYTEYAFYWFENTYFCDDISVPGLLSNVSIHSIPNFMLILNHKYRSENYTKGKSFINTQHVKLVNSHKGTKCLDGHCNYAMVNSDLAHIQHYRRGCQRHVGSAEDRYEKFQKHLVLDISLWELQEQLLARSVDTLSRLGFSVS